MIDIKHIGHIFPPFKSVVEAGRVRLFCKAIGEIESIYLDAEEACNAGYRNILAPITFPTSIVLDNPNPRAVIDLVEVDIGRVLHGQEHYEYFSPICVGDEITAQLKVTDIYSKKGGALEFVVSELSLHNQINEIVCKVKRTIVVRPPQAISTTVGTRS